MPFRSTAPIQEAVSHNNLQRSMAFEGAGGRPLHLAVSRIPVAYSSHASYIPALLDSEGAASASQNCLRPRGRSLDTPSVNGPKSCNVLPRKLPSIHQSPP